MKPQLSVPLLIAAFLLTSCAGNPPQSTVHSPDEVRQKLRQMQEGTQSPTEAQPQVKRSIIPDIREEGHRNEMARRVLDEATAMFLKADMNRDYLISIEEAGRYYPHVSKNFSRYDKDNSQSLTWQELIGHDKWPEPVHGYTKP